jgi:predicted transcriptional regulator
MFMIVSCGPNHNDAEVKQLYEEVMTIHDDVMPKISDISKLRRKIRKDKQESIESLQHITDLEKADDAMMDWMSDFQKYKTYNDSTKESKMKYLNNEKLRIQSVSDQMYGSIESAKKYLNEE